MKRYEITEAEYQAIKAKEATIKDKRISKWLRILMLRYKGKKAETIAEIMGIRPGSITMICRRYKEEGLEEFARKKYTSHNWLLGDALLQHFLHECISSEIVEPVSR